MMIPHNLRTYREGAYKRDTTRHHDELTYETGQGIVDVVLWVQYPTYDFIFGIPQRSHRLFKHEAGFFQIRDRKNYRRTKTTAFYLDRKELEEFYEGFRKMRGHAKKAA